MMAPDALLLRLQSLGVGLAVVDGRLSIEAPRGVISEALLSEMRAHRDDLIKMLSEPVDSLRPSVVHLKREPFDVRIDRATKWGNPFVVGRDGDRETVIRRFREWIVQQPQLMAALPELRGKRLGCWCAPQACHGDVLADLVMKLLGAAKAADWEPIPGVSCPYCRHDRFDEEPSGWRCVQCGKLAWGWLERSIFVRADFLCVDL